MDYFSCFRLNLDSEGQGLLTMWVSIICTHIQKRTHDKQITERVWRFLYNYRIVSTCSGLDSWSKSKLTLCTIVRRPIRYTQECFFRRPHLRNTLKDIIKEYVIQYKYAYIWKVRRKFSSEQSSSFYLQFPASSPFPLIFWILFNWI